MIPVPKPPRRRWYQRWWVWGAIVVAILLCVVAIDVFRATPDGFPASNDQKFTPTPGATNSGAATVDTSRLIRNTSPSLGSPNATVTIVEFADFECPYCEEAFPIIRDLAAKYGDRIHVVFRNYPVPTLHEHAMAAAEAAMCANAQGKFWAYHDKLFQNQEALDDASLMSYAEAVGLDTKTFATCVTTHQMQATVAADIDDGNTLGVAGTPTWFVNGRKVEGVIPEDAFQKAIDTLLQNGQ